MSSVQTRRVLRESLGRLDHRSLLAGCWGGFAWLGAFSFVLNTLLLSAPLYMMQVFDRVLTSRSVPTLVALTLAVGMLLVFAGALDLIRIRASVRMAGRVDLALSGRVFDIVVTRAVKHAASPDATPLRDVSTLRQFLMSPGPLVVLDAPWALIYLVGVFLLHPLLGAISAIGAVLLLALALLNELWIRGAVQDGAKALADETALAAASARNAEVIQAMGMLATARHRWSAAHRVAVAWTGAASDRSAVLVPSSKIVRLMLQCAIIGAGALLVIGEVITPGTMLATSFLMARALAPVEQATGTWRSFVLARESYRRLQAFLAEQPDQQRAMAVRPRTGKLSVSGLFAQPPGSSKPLLKGISFELEAGESLGIIGPSGSGKSTLARVLVGVWPCTAGTVRLDGATLDQWDGAALGRHIGYMPQNVQLFDATVAENIARLDDRFDPESVMRAAQRAGAHGTILSLPDGYNFRVGEDGGRLSGGQRQRVGLARALYNDPVLVVLDEPNANLDADGDRALSRAVRDMVRRGQTVIVIAHRASTLAAVDKILVLENGFAAAFGPREEVLHRLKAGPHGAQTKVAQIRPVST